MSVAKVALGEIIDFKGGGTPRKDVPEYWSGDIPWATVKDFRSTTLSATLDSISEAGLAASAANLIPAGHVIVPTRMALGKAAINSIDLAINQDLRALLPKVDIDNRYLLHAMISLKEDIERWGSGATVKGITQKNLAALQIPLPPLDEQKRIAAILDAADALRAKRQESIQQLDALIQSTFIDMFGDPVTNPMDWPMRRVQDVCRLVRGSSPRPKGDSRFYGGDVPRLMVGDITRDGFWVTPRIDTLTEEGANRSRAVPQGTVVMAVSGNVGVVSIVAVDCCVHDGFVAFLDLSDDVFDPIFLMFSLHLLKLTHERRKAGAIFQNLTTADIKAMELPAPPIKKQVEFAQLIDAQIRFRGKLVEHGHDLEKLHGAVQSRAFAGDL